MNLRLLAFDNKMKIFKKKQKHNIDDVLRLAPMSDNFTVEPLLEQVLTQQKLFTSRDYEFMSGVSIIEQTLLSYELVKQFNDKSLKLTSNGKIAKELGGFTEYLKYRKVQLNSLSSQRRINIGLLIVGFLSICVPVVTECYRHSSDVSSKKLPVHVIVDSLSTNFHLKNTEKQPQCLQQEVKDTLP